MKAALRSPVLSLSGIATASLRAHLIVSMQYVFLSVSAHPLVPSLVAVAPHQWRSPAPHLESAAPLSRCRSSPAGRLPPLFLSGLISVLSHYDRALGIFCPDSPRQTSITPAACLPKWNQCSSRHHLYCRHRTLATRAQCWKTI